LLLYCLRTICHPYNERQDKVEKGIRATVARIDNDMMFPNPSIAMLEHDTVINNNEWISQHHDHEQQCMCQTNRIMKSVVYESSDGYSNTYEQESLYTAYKSERNERTRYGDMMTMR
jgi:hypothetical protein